MDKNLGIPSYFDYRIEIARLKAERDEARQWARRYYQRCLELEDDLKNAAGYIANLLEAQSIGEEEYEAIVQAGCERL